MQPNHIASLVLAEQALAERDATKALDILSKLRPEEVSAQSNFLTGRALLELARYGDAAPILKAAVSAQKGNAAFRLAYGSALHFCGDLTAASAQYREAVRLAPAAENPPFNLGTVLYQAGDYEGAERAYRLALSRKSDFVDALVALADLLLLKNNFAEAGECLTRAISIDPNSANAACVLGTAYERAGQLDLAEAQFDKAVQLDEGYSQAWFHLGRMRGQKGAKEAAVEALNRAIALEPQNEKYDFIRKLYLDSAPDAVGSNETRKMPDAVVRELFDEYAATFEESLVQKLNYQTPEKLHHIIKEWLTTNAPLRNALDLGCGTGLMAPLLRPYVNELTGVDISLKMLAKAADKGYTSLEHSEIEAFLSTREAGSYPLIVAADVFVYIGDLRKVFVETARILSPDGRFAFSVESLDELEQMHDDLPFRVETSGRFSHRDNYIRGLAEEYGLEVQAAERVTLRMDGGKPVIGLVFALRRSGASIGTKISGG